MCEKEPAVHRFLQMLPPWILPNFQLQWSLEAERGVAVTPARAEKPICEGYKFDWVLGLPCKFFAIEGTKITGGYIHHFWQIFCRAWRPSHDAHCTGGLGAPNIPNRPWKVDMEEKELSCSHVMWGKIKWHRRIITYSKAHPWRGQENGNLSQMRQVTGRGFLQNFSWSPEYWRSLHTFLQDLNPGGGFSYTKLRERERKQKNEDNRIINNNDLEG